MWDAVINRTRSVVADVHLLLGMSASVHYSHTGSVLMDVGSMAVAALDHLVLVTRVFATHLYIILLVPILSDICPPRVIRFTWPIRRRDKLLRHVLPVSCPRLGRHLTLRSR